MDTFRKLQCKHWIPTKKSGLCVKHFEEQHLKRGLRITIRWDLNAILIAYDNTDSIPPSVLPTLETSTKLTSMRKSLIPDKKRAC